MSRACAHTASTLMLTPTASHLHGIDDSHTKLLGSGQKPALARAGILAEGLLRCGSAHRLGSPARLNAGWCCSAACTRRWSFSWSPSATPTPFSPPPLPGSISLTLSLGFDLVESEAARDRSQGLLTQPERQPPPPLAPLHARLSVPVQACALCTAPETLGVLELGGTSPGRALQQSPGRAAGQLVAVQPARSSQRRLPGRFVQRGRSPPSVLLLWAPAGMAPSELERIACQPGLPRWGVSRAQEARKCCSPVKQQWSQHCWAEA